jgi:hypothetical protein
MRTQHRPATEIAEARKQLRDKAQQCLASGPYAGRVGAFEGAMYATHGYYRPQQQCIMISGDSFCAVCRRAIEDIIDLYSRP